MEKLSDRLVGIFLSVPSLRDNKKNRGMLLKGLPSNPASLIPRDDAPMTDLNNIVNDVENWGQLDSGEWGLAVLIQNALRFTKGTRQDRDLRKLLNEFEIELSDIHLSPIEEQEIVIGQDERLSIDFFNRALKASKAVSKVLVHRIKNGQEEDRKFTGSGWLAAPDLLITNYHVIEARVHKKELPATSDDFKAQALKAEILFGYDNRESEPSGYSCEELLHFDSRLDYAVLRLSKRSISGPDSPLSAWGYLTMPSLRPTLFKGDRLNIIQHPGGKPKQFAVRSNFYIETSSSSAKPDRIRYLTDTEPGSSGSPVFNDDWQVLALHHASVKMENHMKYKGDVISYNNQGILVHAIIGNLPTAVSDEIQKAQENRS